MLFRPASSIKALKAKLINTEAVIYYADDHMRICLHCANGQCSVEVYQ